MAELTAPKPGDQEDQTVDFKRDYDQGDPKKRRFEMAKDVAAMANAAGGTLWVGVCEDPQKREASAYNAFSKDESAKLENDFEQAVRDLCRPITPRYSIKRVPHGEGTLLLAVLVEGHQSRTAVLLKGEHQNAFVIPIRVNTQTTYPEPAFDELLEGRGNARKLAAVPPGETVRVEQASNPNGGIWNRDTTMVSVDLESQTVTLKILGTESQLELRCRDIREIMDNGERINGVRCQIRLSGMR